MADPKDLLIGLGAAATATLALHLWLRHNPADYPLPPSPKSYPLIGNLLSMPRSNQHAGFMELGKELNCKQAHSPDYSNKSKLFDAQAPIFSLSVLGTVIIGINSVEDAMNLLDKRSSIYSDRAMPTMISDPDLVDLTRFTSALPYDYRWKMHRRLTHPWLHQKAVTAFQSSQQQQARLLLQRIAGLVDTLESSEELFTELLLTLARTLTHSIYGYHLEKAEDPFLVDMQKVFDIGLDAAMPENFLVNVFPSLRHVPEWLPGAGWKRKAREWRELQQNAVKNAYEWAKANAALGDHDASQSMVMSMINQGSQLGLSPGEIDDYVSHAAVTLYGGGSDTTANTILVLVLAMILHPEVQTRAQEEIDSVTGKSRLPVVEDRARLPYTNRLIQELMRWCPIVPTGIPHACVQDDVYQGYKIPKGSQIYGKAMSRDEKYYKDPEQFIPDRFLDVSVPPCPVFGFGRRICPGQHYAATSVFISVASILATFNFTMASDENGKIVPTLTAHNSIIFHPEPFKFKMSLRSAHYEELIQAGI